MHKPIRRVGVIGAGVMGAGIAAHLANAGVHAVLLDIVPPNLTEAEKSSRAARDRFAAGGLDKARKARPAAFFHPSFARLVEIGNVEDDLDKLASCDLIIEAIIEKLEPKRALFEKLEKAAPDAIVATADGSRPSLADAAPFRVVASAPADDLTIVQGTLLPAELAIGGPDLTSIEGGRADP